MNEYFKSEVAEGMTSVSLLLIFRLTEMESYPQAEKCGVTGTLQKSIHMTQKKYTEHGKTSQFSKQQPIYMNESFTEKKTFFMITAQPHPC